MATSRTRTVAVAAVQSNQSPAVDRGGSAASFATRSTTRTNTQKTAGPWNSGSVKVRWTCQGGSGRGSGSPDVSEGLRDRPGEMAVDATINARAARYAAANADVRIVSSVSTLEPKPAKRSKATRASLAFGSLGLRLFFISSQACRSASPLPLRRRLAGTPGNLPRLVLEPRRHFLSPPAVLIYHRHGRGERHSQERRQQPPCRSA